MKQAGVLQFSVPTPTHYPTPACGVGGGLLYTRTPQVHFAPRDFRSNKPTPRLVMGSSGEQASSIKTPWHQQ